MSQGSVRVDQLAELIPHPQEGGVREAGQSVAAQGPLTTAVMGGGGVGPGRARPEFQILEVRFSLSFRKSH